MYNDKRRTPGSDRSRIGTLGRRLRVLGASAAFALATLPAAGSAQVRMTVPPQSEPIALQGATIHTVTDGVIENGTIIFQNGIITAVGANRRDDSVPEYDRTVLDHPIRDGVNRGPLERDGLRLRGDGHADLRRR